MTCPGRRTRALYAPKWPQRRQTRTRGGAGLGLVELVELGLVELGLGLVELGLVELGLGLVELGLVELGLGFVELGFVELGFVELGFVELGLGFVELGLGELDLVFYLSSHGRPLHQRMQRQRHG